MMMSAFVVSTIVVLLLRETLALESLAAFAHASHPSTVSVSPSAASLAAPGCCGQRRFTTALFKRPKRRSYESSSPSSSSYSSSVHTKKGPGNVVRPTNEFSRVYRMDSLLSSRGRGRDYKLEVAANESEMKALANRFDLHAIDRLHARLILRREDCFGPYSNGNLGVEVEGTVSACVTQTCVRTGETFQVDLEFPLYAITRPVTSFSSSSNNAAAADDDGDYDDWGAGRGSDEDFYNSDSSSNSRPNNNNNNNKRNKNSVRAPERNIDEMDVVALQKLLQNVDEEDSVIEDEGIYTMDGTLDVGELVAQLFWLKLDPLPKKPGSDPVFMSISG
uniref:Uncharacterized protein n=1 Tax=Cyclophora tenuis TaxID=216820 RepID=A0A7S1CY52_CYCTE|mmetsp:Transcript_12262/g.20755  ORF Transcript_12262/g.20755 Transcript_12262/m.20755 type:complete len:334 (+) Transcript_12262:73-1074(+)